MSSPLAAGDGEEELPPSTSSMTDINPYTVLSLPVDAPASAISSAYRRAALKSHPDKASPENKTAAHAKFQEVAFAYAILSEPHRRARYDATGSTSESLEDDDDGDGTFDWLSFYRTQFADVVSGDKIDAFSQEWKGSEEEKAKVLEVYVKSEGRMERVYQEVMLSDPCEDEERYRGWIDEAIREGEVEGFEKYVGETEKSKKARVERARKRKVKEAKEAEAEVERMKNGKKGKGKGGDGGMGDLAALIQQRQRGREGDFFAGLEAKYAGGSKKGSKNGGKKDRGLDGMDGPSEEAFAKNRKRRKEEAVDEDDDEDDDDGEVVKKGATFPGSGGKRRNPRKRGKKA